VRVPHRQEDVVVFPPSRYWLAAALGLTLAGAAPGMAAGPAAEPNRLGLAAPSPNQQTADAIAAQLRQSAQLRHYSIDVEYRDGCAAVSGTVADQPQREEVLRLVQGVPGVERVVDRLSVSAPLVQVQAAAPPQPLPPPVPSAPAGPQPAPGGVAPKVNEPVPVFQAPAPSPYDLNPPKMPPYAWPTYAPYNNYSRIGYPNAYPYNAWPFIGPIYPFPKVPLGWRKVVLQWDDGYWWFSKTATKYDWWKLRYY
jgi:hypothetical protein